MTLMETLLLVGVAIIVLPPVLERIGVDLRAGEVITGAVFVLLFPEIQGADWLTAVAEFGLLVLMFEIGLDIDIHRLQETMHDSIAYAVLAFILPFGITFVGVAAAGFSPTVALIVAIGLSSSALAVVSPLMQRRDIDSPVIKNAVMFTEMLGITLLFGFVQSRGASPDQLLVQTVSVIGFVLFTIFFVPRLTARLHLLEKKRIIRFEMKLVLFLVLALAIVSEQLGIHAATGAFLAGLFFAESTHRGLELEERLQPVSDLLVPIFFFHIGLLMDPLQLGMVDALIAGGLAAVVYAIRYVGFRTIAPSLGLDYRFRDVNLFAPCITITATAASVGRELHVLSTSVFTTFLLAGLLLTVIGPLLSAHRERLAILTGSIR